MFYELLIEPFVEYTFMRTTLLGAVFLSLSAGPMGSFLILKRLSLVADAMSHAILPGVAIAFLLSGLSLFWMTIGGMSAGLLIALLSGWIARSSKLKEETSFAALYLISLAFGVLLISSKGNNLDLIHVLFGSPIGLGKDSIVFIMFISSLSLISLSLLYRGLIAECLDPIFMKLESNKGLLVHTLFLTLFVLNLVAGFQIFGTLMVVGMMLLPAASAKLLYKHLPKQILASMIIGLLSSYSGLILSFHLNITTSPMIILISGFIYFASLIISTYRSK